MEYQLLKGIHVLLALTSVSLFATRGAVSIRSDIRRRAVLPHVLDTLLLASGVWLALMVGWRPTVHPWLATKLVLLVVYILLAAVAMQPRVGRRLRWGLYAAALTTFGWMALVAVTKHPLGPFAP